jgi:hypothetical protein
MKGKIPMSYPLFLSKLYGFQLSYAKNWKDSLIKIWFNFNMLCFGIGIISAVHAFAFNLNDITYFTESLVVCFNWTMCLIRMLTFANRRDRLRTLVEDLRAESRESKLENY